jgi:cytoskeletal protein CcmA (bactofilin family)
LEDDDMWKRERTEPVNLEQVLSEPSAQVATNARLSDPAPSPAPERPEETTLTAPSTPAAPAKTSTIGPTLRFKGDLVADEDLVIQGQVEGTILHSRSLTIGTQGRVVGEIRARRIVVEGAIKGNLYALESVTLRSGAAVHGDVFAPRIVVEEGARLTGRIDMENAPAVPRVSLPASGASESSTGDLSDQQAAVLLSGS